MLDDASLTPPTSEKPFPPNVLLVSLFLMLLVFFIVLQGNSSPNLKRQEQIADNLHVVFGAKEKPAITQFPSPPSSPAKDAYMLKLAAALQQGLQLERPPGIQKGYRIEIVLPLDHFFAAGTSNFLSNTKTFYTSLGDFLHSAPQNLPLEIETTLSFKSAADSLSTLAIGRGQQMALGFTQLPTPPHDIRVGLTTQKEAMILFIFRLKEHPYHDGSL